MLSEVQIVPRSSSTESDDCHSTPDANFLITDHPDHKGLYIAGGASAHGFKVRRKCRDALRHLLRGGTVPTKYWKTCYAPSGKSLGSGLQASLEMATRAADQARYVKA
jgi:hypothetical protein